MATLQIILTKEQYQRLQQDLDHHTYTFLDDLLKTHTSSTILDCIIQNNSFGHEVVSHLTSRVPLAWFWDLLSIDHCRQFIFWSILFAYSFRYSQDPARASVEDPVGVSVEDRLFQRLCVRLQFGDYEFWLSDEFATMSHAEFFWNTIIHTGDESLIQSSVDYLSKYREEHSGWYKEMIETFIDISTDTRYLFDDYLTLSKSPTFRKWLKEVPGLISYYFRHSLKHACELQEAQETINHSYKVVASNILEDRLPIDLVKYVIFKYL